MGTGDEGPEPLSPLLKRALNDFMRELHLLPVFPESRSGGTVGIGPGEIPGYPPPPLRLPIWVPGNLYIDPSQMTPEEAAAGEELRLLIKQTEAELEIYPDYAVLLDDVQAERRDADARLINQLETARAELLDNLKAMKENPGAYSGMTLANWKEALYEAGQLRKTVCFNVGVLDEERIARERKALGELSEGLGHLKGKLESIETEFKRIEGLEEDAEMLDKALTALEVVEAVGHGQAKMAAGGTVSLGELGAEAGKIEMKSMAIEAGIHAVAEAAKMLGVAAEGYDSVEDLERDINVQVAAVQGQMKEVLDAETARAKAKEQYDAPVYGTPRP
jgi:hypothetical protein